MIPATIHLLAVFLRMTEGKALVFRQEVDRLARKQYGGLLFERNNKPFEVPIEIICGIVVKVPGSVKPADVVASLGPWVSRKRSKRFGLNPFCDGQTKLPDNRITPVRLRQIFRGGLVGVGGKRKK